MFPQPLALIALLSLLLVSCSTVKQTVSRTMDGAASAANHVSSTASRAYQASKRSTLNAFDKVTGKDHGLQIVEADSKRFLSSQTKLIDGKPAKPTPKRYLASNTAKPQSLPPLDLPPLPASSEENAFPGILPPLDGSNAPTSIDSDAELPPMPEIVPELPTEELDNAA